MNRLLKYTGFLVWIGLIVFGSVWICQNFTAIVEPSLIVLGVIFIIYIIVKIYYGKDSLLGIGKEFIVGNDLINATENFLNDLPKPKKEITSNFIGHLIYRFTRLGLIGLSLAAIPIWLLFQQNNLLQQQNDRFDFQNELIKKQNKRLDQQTHLQEAERRSSLVFLLSNVLDKLDDEIKSQAIASNTQKINEKNQEKYHLSTPLITRISALSRAFSPYRRLVRDSLEANWSSPERGQLFISLIGNNLDSLTQNTIFQMGDFHNAEIGEIEIIGAKMRKANFQFLRLKNSVLRNIDLSSSDMSGTDLSFSKIYDSRFANAHLSGINLVGAIIENVDFRNVNFSYAILITTEFKNVDFTGATFDNADLSGLRLLENVKITKEQLIKARKIQHSMIGKKLESELRKERPCLFTNQGCESHIGKIIQQKTQAIKIQ